MHLLIENENYQLNSSYSALLGERMNEISIQKHFVVYDVTIQLNG